ncbi:extracellular solute-binding protein [Peristeroidobacter agariperforans]|uniref:extracellular solute-binding protein n=1 Tax=Peristeroidobacter agariperforans TaxID=268404 RepID=UPI0018E576D9|nr:extracellular solute-binding protein [Peristeroidobacter agariperforans]
MIRPIAILLSCLALTSCGVQQPPNEIVVQRFFGTCNAQYGTRTDVAAAEGECGIMTTLINKFSAENPDVRVRVSPVAWPGYNQLAAQLAAGDPPDLVTMHLSSIPDYQSRALIEPLGKDLRAVGVDPQGFTAASSAGVNIQGDVFGLPIDNWAPLWHINMNYFRQAGLVKDGKPILPRSPEELLEHARRFKAATGKPYLVQTLAIERASYARNLYTLLMQQNATIFPDPQHIHLQSPEAKRVVDLFRQIYVEDLTTKNLDYAASTNAFINGAGGVFIVGTWLIGDFEAESRRADRPLSNGYTVRPFPQLYAARDATYIDGHAWVMPAKERTPQQRDAVFRLLKFFADNDFEWSRTGHLPAYQAVIDSERFNALPHRREIAKLSATGMTLPASVQRQFPVADIVGEEMSAAITGHKTVDAALADAEHRINDLLFHVL